MSEQALAAASEPFLFPLPEDVTLEMRRQGRYDGLRLRRDRPDTYQTIVALLSEGQSIRAIKRLCRVHHETIKAVAALEEMAIDTGKEKVLAELRLGQLVLAESLTEDIMEDRLRPEAKAVALGIITDKIELLAGNATVRIETTTSEAPAKTWDEWLERMKRAKPAQEMGLSGEESGQRDLAPVRVHALPTPPSDSGSGVSSSPPSSVPDDAPLSGGEGGGRNRPGPPA